MSDERTMGRLEFGPLRGAWRGEASDFTPLLAEQLDAIGAAIGVDLIAVGQAEVATAGGRSIDIVAQTADGPEFVIENQYGRADHDHLTRGLAYAVAREARGLVVVAEEHRDEFRAVAQYLNDLAERDRERGIAVWLVEAKAVRIAGSPWAPLFTAVVSPNEFTAKVEQAKQAERTPTLEEFIELCETPAIRDSVATITARWRELGHPIWRWPNYITLAAKGPSKNGERGVIGLHRDGSLIVPFGAYAGQNTGIPIDALATSEFRERTDAKFGLTGTPTQGRTPSGWLGSDVVDSVLAFAIEVADTYVAALAASDGDGGA
jgi:hypothetical protein